MKFITFVTDGTRPSNVAQTMVRVGSADDFEEALWIAEEEIRVRPTDIGDYRYPIISIEMNMDKFDIDVHVGYIRLLRQAARRRGYVLDGYRTMVNTITGNIQAVLEPGFEVW